MVIKQATEQDFAMAVFSRHSGCPVRPAMGLSWFCGACFGVRFDLYYT